MWLCVLLFFGGGVLVDTNTSLHPMRTSRRRSPRRSPRRQRTRRRSGQRSFRSSQKLVKKSWVRQYIPKFVPAASATSQVSCEEARRQGKLYRTKTLQQLLATNPDYLLSMIICEPSPDAPDPLKVMYLCKSAKNVRKMFNTTLAPEVYAVLKRMEATIARPTPRARWLKAYQSIQSQSSSDWRQVITYLQRKNESEKNTFYNRILQSLVAMKVLTAEVFTVENAKESAFLVAKTIEAVLHTASEVGGGAANSIVNVVQTLGNGGGGDLGGGGDGGGGGDSGGGGLGDHPEILPILIALIAIVGIVAVTYGAHSYAAETKNNRIGPIVQHVQKALTLYCNFYTFFQMYSMPKRMTRQEYEQHLRTVGFNENAIKASSDAYDEFTVAYKEFTKKQRRKEAIQKGSASLKKGLASAADRMKRLSPIKRAP